MTELIKIRKRNPVNKKIVLHHLWGSEPNAIGNGKAGSMGFLSDMRGKLPHFCIPLAPDASTLMAARMELGGGEVNTAPATAALNMPGPTYPETFK